MDAKSTAFDGQAQWIWSSGQPVPDAGTARPAGSLGVVRYFRRTFQAGRKQRLLARVSADSRYNLWCNGELVARGPAKGDIAHHFYETLDLTTSLREGENVLAAQVMYFGDGDAWPNYSAGGPSVSIMTACPGFVLDGRLLEASGETAATLHSDGQWKTLGDRAYLLRRCPGHAPCVGPFEEFAAESFPWGFQLPEYDDSAWEPAAAITRAVRVDMAGDTFRPHRLLPRMVALLEEAPRLFVRGASRLTLPAGETATLCLDARELATGYPRITLSGTGRVRLTYAEARIEENEGAGEHKFRKSHRDDPSFGSIVGQQDEIICEGPRRQYEPFLFRTFRYVQVELTAGAQPLKLEGLDYVFTAYPFADLAQFESSENSHKAIWDLCWRTARLCAHETYEDCPYYEQLQYGGDTQVQAMISYYVAGDASLARQFLYQFDWSRQPSGLTRSRYPARVPQTIPCWSHHWAMSVADYWRHTGDVATLLELLPGVLTFTDYLDRKIAPNGTIGQLDGWRLGDWSRQWNATQDGVGVPPGASRGQAAFESLISIATLQDVSELCQAAAEVAPAPAGRQSHYRAMAAALGIRVAALREATHRIYYDAQRGLYLDRPVGVPAPSLSEEAKSRLLAWEDVHRGHGLPTASAYTNAWAILAGMPVDHGALAERIVADETLCELTMFSQYFACRALAQARRYDLLGDFLAPWRQMLQWGLSTCPEHVDFASTRSDCHAWSAAPLVEFCREILGVRPLQPGYKAIALEPQPAGLSFARGRVPLTRLDGTQPARFAQVSWRIEAGRFILEAQVPPGVPCQVLLPSGKQQTFPQGGKISLSDGHT